MSALHWLVSASALLAVSATTRIEDARLEATSGAWTVDAGVVLTLVRLDLAHAGARTEVYAVQLKRDEQIPSVGARCSIEATPRRVDGSTADGRSVRGTVLFADRIECDGREYLSDG